MKTKSQLFAIGFVSASIFFAAAANACPNLNGTYLCPKNQFHPDVLYTYTQTPTGTSWHYTVSANVPTGALVSYFEFSTDLVNQKVVEKISGTKLLVTASCTPKALRVQGVADYEKPNPIRFSELINLTAEGHLSNLSHDLEGTPYHEVCLRQ